MNFAQNPIRSTILSIIGLIIFCAFFALGLFIFSYLLILGAIIGLIIFTYAYIRGRLLNTKLKSKKNNQGRTIEHNSNEPPYNP